MKDVIDGLYDQAEAILIATVFLLVIFSVIQTFLKSRSWVPTIGVLLVGAVALWGVNSVEWFGGKVDETIDETDGGGDGDRGRLSTGD
jgi:hypothetical protein